MREPASRSAERWDPRVPKADGAVAAPVEEDVGVEPVQSPHVWRAGGCIAGEGPAFEGLGAVYRPPGGIISLDEGAAVRRRDGEVESCGVRAGRGGPEGAAMGVASEEADVGGVREGIVVPFVRLGFRVILVIRPPYFRVDELGQVNAGGLAATH